MLKIYLFLLQLTNWRIQQNSFESTHRLCCKH